MTPERARQIAAELTSWADAMEGATAAPGPVHKPGELFDRQLLGVQALAGRLRVTEKTARRVGSEAGARFQIGGRVYFDLDAIERHAARGRVLPSFAVSPELASCEDPSIDEDA